MIRVPRYVQWLHEGKVLAGQTLTVVNEGPVTAMVDGNYGFGQTIGPLAVDLGIAKARTAGLAVVALRHSGHLGRIGDWGERAAAAGLVSLHFVNVESGELVAPFGGVDRRFSTNPICIGVPSDGTAPMLLLDLATSLVAEGKVLVASNGGKPVPEGALMRPDGQLLQGPRRPLRPAAARRAARPGDGGGRDGGVRRCTRDRGLPSCARSSAACCPAAARRARSRAASVRGSATACSRSIVDPAKFGGGDFIGGAREYANYVKASRPVTPGGEVLVPGEPEARTRAERLAKGVPLQEETWVAICATARGLRVAAPE